MTKSFNVEVHTKELSLLLEKVIVSSNAKLITKVIMGNLDTTSVGLQQLFKALNGIDNEIIDCAFTNILWHVAVIPKQHLQTKTTTFCTSPRKIK